MPLSPNPRADALVMKSLERGEATRAFVERQSADAMDAMDALRRIVRRVHEAEQETEQALGVTAAQLFVLREVAKVQPLTISALAHATATSQSSVSEVVNRLVARELLTRERSRTDRRRAEIRLSSSGRELLSRASETVQEQLIAGFQRLPDTTQRALSESLSRWLVEAGLSDIGPSMFFESTAS
jgi:DNA-binding MarR family transcriptional regulator